MNAHDSALRIANPSESGAEMNQTIPSERNLLRQSLLEEIARRVAAAHDIRDVLDPARHARQLIGTYPQAGYCESEIYDALVKAAMAAGVALDLDQTRPR